MSEAAAPAVSGWIHPSGRGIRRHLLVIPSVICAAQAARRIADTVPRAVAIEHQHGCAQLGGDARLTQHVLTQLGTHPNVAATLVVSLGCETVQGSQLHRAIAARGQRAAFVGIQQEGGTLAAVQAGRAALLQLSRDAEADPRVELSGSDLVIGIDASWDAGTPAQAASILDLIARLREIGAIVVQAVPVRQADAVAWWQSRCAAAGRTAPPPAAIAYASAPPTPGAYVMEAPSARIAQKTGLAAAGAHVIVSPLASGLPAGSPITPVVHLGLAPYAKTFREDVDMMLDEEAVPAVAAGSAVDAVVRACREETVLEAMGDFEMAIHRIGPTM